MWTSAVSFDGVSEPALEISNKKEIITYLLVYAKQLSCSEAEFLDKMVIANCLSLDEDILISYQMSCSETCDRMTNNMSNGSDDDQQNEMSEKKQMSH